jgi:glutamate transport system permease protein
MSMSTIYDAPGPIARRRARIASIVAAAVILALLVWVIYLLASPRVSANGARTPGVFDASRIDILGDPVVWQAVVGGLSGTLQMAAVAAAGAMFIGILFSFARLSEVRWIRTPTAVVLEFFRGMPILLMMLFILLVLSTGPFWAGVLALAVYNGALIGEALRAGILALPRGQREAGLSIGLTKFQTRMQIEFPQAFRQMLPVIIAQMVVLLKDTSLAYVVGYHELLRSVTNMQNFFGNRYLFTLFAIVVVVYLSVNLLLSWLARYVARRTGSHTREMAMASVEAVGAESA